MSNKDDCYEAANYAGNEAGIFAGGAAGATTAMATAPLGPVIDGLSTGAATLAATNLADYGVSHLGQSICDAQYEHPLVAMEFDQSSNMVTYGFGNEHSSAINFEYHDMSCQQPYEDGLCISPAHDAGADHAAAGTDSVE